MNSSGVVVYARDKGVLKCVIVTAPKEGTTLEDIPLVSMHDLEKIAENIGYNPAEAPITVADGKMTLTAKDGVAALTAGKKLQMTANFANPERVIIPRTESNRSAVQIHLSAYQSSLHLSRTCDLRSCLTASLTSEASSDFQQSRGCKTTSVITLDSFCGKVDSLRGLGGSETANHWT